MQEQTELACIGWCAAAQLCVQGLTPNPISDVRANRACLYRIVRCCPAIGCTVEAFDVPKKMLAISIAPHSAAMPSGEVLHQTLNITVYQKLGIHNYNVFPERFKQPTLHHTTCGHEA